MPSLVAIGLVVVIIQQLKYFTWPCKTTWSKDLVNLWKETPHCISPPCPTDSHRHYVNGYMILLVCQVLLQGLGIIWSCESMGRSHHPAKFCAHRHYDSEDIMFLVCYVISQNHVIMWLFDFIGKMQSKQVTILLSFVAIDIVVMKI